MFFQGHKMFSIAFKSMRPTKKPKLFYLDLVGSYRSLYDLFLTHSTKAILVRQKPCQVFMKII